MLKPILGQPSGGPVVVGGLGGSGTRLIAECLRALGYFMGHDLNKSNDNVWFRFLFKRREILACSDDEFSALIEIFLRSLASEAFTDTQCALLMRLAEHSAHGHLVPLLIQQANMRAASGGSRIGARWGWKEPNAHVVINRLRKVFPEMKYIHVIRNGLDMAHSSNQNQLELWGEHFLGARCEPSPRNALKFWRKVHERVLEQCSEMGGRFFLLHYESFCRDPDSGGERLLRFLGIEPSPPQIDGIRGIIKVPESINRFRAHGTDIFDPEDLAFARKLGFETGQRLETHG